jgi:deoxycytidylate deaminase
MIGKCAKQETIAIIENHGQYWVGTNCCLDAQKECPRQGMATGIGYELCKEICKQTGHAEVNACKAAGENANGGTLYLVGHTYCCTNCLAHIREHGIDKIVIGKLPYSFYRLDL